MSLTTKWAMASLRSSLRYRCLCAKAAPSSSSPLGQSISTANPAAHGPMPKPQNVPPSAAEHVITARVAPVVPAAPSINSTGLGITNIGDIPDPHTNDPLKWKKAAWKYLGALAIFGVFYKGLHWYVDGVAEKAKQKRDDMEIAKTAVYETAADRAAMRAEDARKEDTRKAQQALDAAKNPAEPAAEVIAKSASVPVSDEPSEARTQSPPQTVPENAMLADTQEQKIADTGFQVFPPIRDDPVYVSPEDEVKLLEVELEARLKKLRALKTKTRDSEAEKRAVKSELRDVRVELATFAKVAAEKEAAALSPDVGSK